MPTHSGVTFEVLSQLELSVHPEFLHPESSQFTFRSPGRKSATADWNPPTVTAVSKADALLGRNTTCSVYIPSVAGAQFWLRYSFNDAAKAHSKYYYFKLFMNGRHMASFGSDSHKNPTGQVMYGLFDPSPKWNYEFNGEVWKNNGLEVRPFFFAKASKLRSFAKDGGLIEVLCYRAIGRRRKLPDPETWRDQQDYGIVTTSEGLLANPEDAKFYDWDLKDGKKDPFIVFKFHYRSWDSLQTLELIPPGHPRTMIPPSRKVLPEELEAMLKAKENGLHFLNSPHSCDDCLVPIPTFADTSSIDSTNYDLFNDPPAKVSKQADNEQESWSENEISPLNIRRHRRRRAPTSKFSELLEDEMSHDGSPTLNRKGPDEFLNRPLPEIPIRKSSRQLSRTSSIKSQAPSVTPSLLSCLDRELSPSELEIGVAKVVQVLGPISPPNMPSLQSDSDCMETSNLVETPVKNGICKETIITTDSSLLPSIEEMSPMLPRNRPASPTGFSPQHPITVIKRKPVASAPPLQQQYMTAAPDVDMLASPNVTLRKHRRSTFKKLPKSNTIANLAPQREKAVPSAFPARSSSNASAVSESQWMSRIPTLPESASIHAGLIEYTHSNPSSSHSSSGLKSAMNMFTTRSSSLGNTIKRNSTSWYRKTRASISSNETGNSALLETSSKASSMDVPDPDNWI